MEQRFPGLQEDEALLAGVAFHTEAGNNLGAQWGDIAGRVKTRNAKQCRDRYASGCTHFGAEFSPPWQLLAFQYVFSAVGMAKGLGAIAWLQPNMSRLPPARDAVLARTPRTCRDCTLAPQVPASSVRRRQDCLHRGGRMHAVYCPVPYWQSLGGHCPHASRPGASAVPCLICFVLARKRRFGSAARNCG